MTDELQPHDFLEDEMGYCSICGGDIGDPQHDCDEDGEDGTPCLER